MKLASFRLKSTGKPTIGVVLEKGLLDLHAASDGTLPSSMIEFLEQGPEAMALARNLASKGAGPVHALDDVELQAPVPKPGKIMHTSCNFLPTWKS
jgi:hypothetical protein